MPWKWCNCSCWRPEVETIRELDFNHHLLKDVPADVFAHERSLEQLHLEANRITELPRALFHCHGLRVLNLSDNDIKVMPPAIASLINLQHLNLSKNSLSDIPDNIKCCKLLSYMNISVNPLEKLPEGFTQLIALEELYLSDTFLEYLPANFGRLSKLRVLDLRENNLNTLPKSITRLANLKLIDIGHNEFSDLPEVIGNLPELTELWADNNKIRSIPSFIGNLVHLKHLDLSSNNIHWIASEIQKCQQLSFLVLTSNELQTVPDEIGNLKELEILKVDDNDLEGLPATIGKLTNLEELVVSQNVIEALPSTIGLLRKMKSINADDNRISALPSELCSCSGLRILSVRSNMLETMPAEIGHLSSVRVINVSDNLLRNLPVSVLNLTHLTALWLSTNQATPLTTLQQDIDLRTGQTVCVNFMFPQVEQDRVQHSREDYDLPVSVERVSRPHIRFADTTDSRHPSRLTRAPTPYPKELRSMAKHARILVTRPMSQSPHHPPGEREEVDPLLGDIAPGLDPRAVTIKTAMVKKQRGTQGEGVESVVLPSEERRVQSSGQSVYKGLNFAGDPDPHLGITSSNIYMPLETNSPPGTGTFVLTQHNRDNTTYVGTFPHESATDLPQESVTDLPSIIYAGNFSSDGMLLEDRQILTDGEDVTPREDPPLLSTPSVVPLPTELHLNGVFFSKFLSENYSGSKVPPPYHIAAIRSKQAAYFMHSVNSSATNKLVLLHPSLGDTSLLTEVSDDFSARRSAMQEISQLPLLPPTNGAMREISQLPLSPPTNGAMREISQLPLSPPANDAMQEISQLPLSPPAQGWKAAEQELLDKIEDTSDAGDGFSLEKPEDLSMTQEAPTDVQASTSSMDDAPSSPLPLGEEHDTTNGYGSDKEMSADVGVKCRIPILKDSIVRSLPKPQLAAKARPPTAVQPVKGVTKIPSFRDAKSSPPRQTNGMSTTRIKQPGFHTSSQPLATPPATPDENINTLPKDHRIPDNNTRPDGHVNRGESPTSSGSGDNTMQNSGFKSRIPALSPGKQSPLWVFGQHKNPTVFPVMIVKNPGLGFSIGGGAGCSTENPGILVSKVHPGGPASSILQPGDKILEVDGIDFLKLEHDQAVGILKQTKNVVNMMMSRQK